MEGERKNETTKQVIFFGQTNKLSKTNLTPAFAAWIVSLWGLRPWGPPGDVGVNVRVPALTQPHRAQTKPEKQTHLLAFPKLFLSFGTRSTWQRQSREMT